MANTENIKNVWSSTKTTCINFTKIDEKDKNRIIREILQALNIQIPHFVMSFILNLASSKNLVKIVDVANKNISILDNKVDNS